MSDVAHRENRLVLKLETCELRFGSCLVRRELPNYPASAAHCTSGIAQIAPGHSQVLMARIKPVWMNSMQFELSHNTPLILQWSC